MPPRFQVFVSSTFRDLRDERQAALEAILELGHFPAGMEAFPAADATPWELITTIIADSDYYVLIVGGKYGSTGPEGISYTEMEFNLALELKKPILAFLHGDPDQIPAGKVELNQEARARLEQFRIRVSERTCKLWTGKEELKSAVLLAIVHAIRTRPAVGWVRNEGLENQELLRRLAALQERYDALASELKALRATVASQAGARKFQDLDAPFVVQISIYSGQIFNVTVPLVELFINTAENMLVPCNETRLRHALRDATIQSLAPASIAKLTRGVDKWNKKYAVGSSELAVDSVAGILLQFLALGLIEPQMVLQRSDHEVAASTPSPRCWVLTPTGRARYLEKVALPADDG